MEMTNKNKPEKSTEMNRKLFGSKTENNRNCMIMILYEFLDDLLYKKDIKKAYFLTNRLYVEYSKTEEYYDSYDEETRSRTTYGKKYYPIENMKNIENYIDVRYVEFEHPEHDLGYNKKQCYDLKKNKKIEYYESYSRPTKDKIYKTFKNLNHVLFEVRYNIYQPRKDWRKYDAEILGYSFTYNLDDVLDKPEYKNYYKICEYYCVQNYNDKFGIIDTNGKVII